MIGINFRRAVDSGVEISRGLKRRRHANLPASQPSCHRPLLTSVLQERSSALAVPAAWSFFGSTLLPLVSHWRLRFAGFNYKDKKALLRLL